MPASKELLDRGHGLAKQVEELAMKEPDPAMRISAVFNACFTLAVKLGMQPDIFLEFCTRTVGAIVLQAVTMPDDGFPDVEKGGSN